MTRLSEPVLRRAAPAPAAPSATGASPGGERRAAWCGWQVVLGPAVVALGVRLATGARPIDDAFITFRYARNLAEGLGLVYNPGEWVLGTTAPLWALLLGGGFWLGWHDLPWLAACLSAAADAASAALLAGLSLRLGCRPLAAALVGLAWACNPMSVDFASGGMETSLFVLMTLLSLSLACGVRGTPTRPAGLPVAAALAGLAGLVRPEGMLLAATLIGWTWRARPDQTRRVMLAATIPLALGGLASLASYGRLLPHSLAAKQVAYAGVGRFDNLLALALQAGAPGGSPFLLGVLAPTLGAVLAAAGVLALAELTRRGLPHVRRQGIVWQPFATFGTLLVAFYVLIGFDGVRLFSWYLVPIAPIYLLAAASGLARLGARPGAWLAALLVVWQLVAIDWHQPFLPAGDARLREQLLLQVGHDLADSLPPSAVIAAPEIGALGWAANRTMLDTVGLVSPAALAYYPLPADQLVADNAVPARLIDDAQPDAVVTFDAYAERSLMRDPTFTRSYRLEAAYPGSVWLSHELLVFRRRDRAPGP